MAFAFAAADILLETDARGTVRFAAGALGRFFGDAIDKDHLVGRPLAALLAVPDRPLLEVLLEDIAAGGRRGPLAVANDAGDTVADCSLLRQSDQSAVHVVLRLSNDGVRTAQPAGADKATGLLDGRDLAELAEAAFERAMVADRALDVSLVRLVGGAAIPGGVDGDAGRALVSRLAAALRAISLDGRAAARLGEDRFAVLHAGAGPVERLDDLVERQLSVMQLDGLRVERQTLPLRDPALSPAEACAALRYALDSFAAAEPVAVSDVAQALEWKLADTARRVADAKSVVDTRAFFVVYQPIVGLTDRRLHHFEALSRLHARHYGIQEFVTFAETVGFVTEFDLAVVRQVLDALAKLRRRHEQPQVAVNLSARSLASDGFVDQLLRLTASAGPNAGQLLFEVTETFQLTDLARANAIIQRLRQAGSKVCLDDFGAGAAAFHYIRALDVDFVKLDGAFVRGVLSAERDRAVLTSMVELCRSLQVAAIAEMVETEAQAADLQRLGVDFGQGYLFGRPLPQPTRARVAA